MDTKSLSGGEKLEAYLKSLADKLGSSGTLNVGFLEGAKYDDGTPVAYIAAVNEFGGTIEAKERQQTIYRSVGKDGTLLKSGKFVKQSKSNYETTHKVKAHTITIPPRPYFRTMIAAKSGDWGPALGKLLKATDYSTEDSLKMMGEVIRGELQESIADFSSPANAASTVRSKGFDDPLVDTGHMLDSVDFEVKEKS